MLRKIRDFLTWSNLTQRLRKLLLAICQFLTWSTLKPRIRQFVRDFAKFMVFDTISTTMITLIVIHLAVPGI